MPNYEFSCHKCKIQFERFFRMCDNKKSYCLKCEKECRRLYSNPQVSIFKPYISHNLTKEPGEVVEVTSKLHFRECAKRMGYLNADDM